MERLESVKQERNSVLLIRASKNGYLFIKVRDLLDCLIGHKTAIIQKDSNYLL